MGEFNIACAKGREPALRAAIDTPSGAGDKADASKTLT